MEDEIRTGLPAPSGDARPVRAAAPDRLPRGGPDDDPHGEPATGQPAQVDPRAQPRTPEHSRLAAVDEHRRQGQALAARLDEPDAEVAPRDTPARRGELHDV